MNRSLSSLLVSLGLGAGMLAATSAARAAGNVAWATCYQDGTFAAANTYTASGLPTTMTHPATGQYTVTFGGVGANETFYSPSPAIGGNVQVTAWEIGGLEIHPRCEIENWGAIFGPDVSVNVRCHAPGGAPIDTNFDVFFWRQQSGDVGGYVWAGYPTTPGPYAADSAWSWSSTGAANTVARRTLGQYDVAMPGLLSRAGVITTAYGSDGEYCNVAGWGSGSIAVHCFDATGNPADARFSLMFANRVPADHYGGYLWANDPAPSISPYLPSTYYQDNATATSHLVYYNGLGDYSAMYPGTPYVSSVVLSTGYGADGVYCNGGARFGGPPGSGGQVRCYDAAGHPWNSYFTHFTITSQIIPG
jgi:hypothetical protein